jgi:hypothetical protein
MRCRSLCYLSISVLSVYLPVAAQPGPLWPADIAQKIFRLAIFQYDVLSKFKPLCC